MSNAARAVPGLKSQPPTVTDRASAEAFIRWCVREIGPVYHPENGSAEYTERDNTPSFTPEEVRTLDALHEAAFRFLADPSTVALDEMKKLQAK